MLSAAVLAHRAIGETDYFSSLYADFLSENRFLLTRFPCSYRHRDCWKGLSERPRPERAGAETWRELDALHERLGAPRAARETIAALAEGSAVAVIAGQQPDPLGGPLFTLHKAATAVAAARRYERLTGVRAVPLFWIAGEDSDFEEIRSARGLGAGLENFELRLPDSVDREGGMVGAIPVEVLRPLWREALGAWEGLEGAALVGRWLEEAGEAARDLSEVNAVLLLRALGDRGLAIVDPRLPAFRRAAVPLYRRYLTRLEEVRSAVENAGRELEELHYGRPIHPASSEFSLFRVEDGRRTKADPASAAAALERGEPLTPNVVLRPVVQDALLPTVFQISGAGEVAYLSQLKEVYGQLETPMAVSLPRLSATWLPAAAVRLIEREGVDVWRLVRETDAALAELFEARLDPEVRAALEETRARTGEKLEGLARTVERVDASLPQLAVSVRAKIDYQFRRLHDGVVSKLKSRFDKSHPQVGRLRHALRPQDKPQERRLAWLNLIARRGTEVASEALALADRHVEQAVEGEAGHFLVAIGEEGP